MPAFAQRHCLYKTGVVVLWLSTLAAVWGVVCPGWLEDGGFYTGLWWSCKVVFVDCVVVNLTESDPLSLGQTTYPVFYAVVGFSCLGVATLLVTSLTVLRHECCVTSTWTGRGAGFSAVLGGIMLGIGFGLFDHEARDASHKLGPSALAAILSAVAATLAGVAMAAFGGRATTTTTMRTVKTTSSDSTPLLPSPRGATAPPGPPRAHSPPPPYDYSSSNQWAYQGSLFQPDDYSSSGHPSLGPHGGGVQPQFPLPAMPGPPMQDNRGPSAPAPDGAAAMTYSRPRSGGGAVHYSAGSVQVLVAR